MNKIIKLCLDFLLPPTCPICRQKISDPAGLCPKCFSDLEFIGPQRCSVCGRPMDAIVPGMAVCGSCLKNPPPFHQAIAVLKYNDISKKLILAFKHGDHLELTKLLIKLINQNCSQIIEQNDILIPVPLHWSRLLKRKYNQSAIIAHKLALEHKKVYDPTILKRLKATKSQGHLSPKEREKNVKNVFGVEHSNRIKNKHVLLIDDVYTTGSTVNECSKILLKAGAKQIDVLTLAKVVKN